MLGTELWSSGRAANALNGPRFWAPEKLEKKKSAVVENELKDLSVLGKYLATKLYSQSS